MTLPAPQLILLDTSVVVHLARNNETGKHIEATYALSKRVEKPLISTITEGELIGFAKRRNWGGKKLDALREMLNEFVSVSAGSREVVDAYAEIYSDSERTGHPAGNKQNDLWIAATAKATNSILLTCDTDFDWLEGRHLTRTYIDPDVR